jgi:hypothetical protein
MPNGTQPRPHRGVLVLVLGILGLAMCPPFGTVAWVLGGSDLRAMDAGEMDPTGRGLTSAGRIIGIIATVLGALAVLVAILIVFLTMLGTKVPN